MSVWLALSPLLAMVATGLVAMLVDVLVRSPASDADTRGDLAIITTVGLFASAALALGLWGSGPSVALPESLGGVVAVDRFGLFFAATIGLGGGLSALIAGGYLAEHGIERGEYYPLIAFSCAGAALMAMATDLLVLFVGLETMSLAVYCLAGFRRGSRKSLEGALKYFLLGSFAAAFLLFGIALLYVLAASTRIAEISEALRGAAGSSPIAVLALVLLLTGLGFKISAVPFHMWTPDAYEGAPTPVTAFMSVVVKAAAFAALLRVLLVAFGGTALGASVGWPQIVAFFAVASMSVGNLVAIWQKNVKRMLAYSSIAHAGYVLVGVLAAWKGAPEGRAGVLFYLLSYTVMNIGAFACVAYFGRRDAEAVHTSDFAGVARQHPAAALALATFMVALTGMPPTAGFFAKLYVFRSAIDAGLWPLVVVAVLNSAVSAYYYLNLVVTMYMRSPEPGAPVAQPMRSGAIATAIVICALLVLHLGIWPSRLLSMALEAGW
ncbi:MAG: NADH-quinone oxidoreductase subunit N [Deltaproteobacteria bacterium]|nr:NADH-quinone oxidoreductase subunit N [Deltaproteobacteria bacterium]